MQRPIIAQVTDDLGETCKQMFRGFLEEYVPQHTLFIRQHNSESEALYYTYFNIHV